MSTLNTAKGVYVIAPTPFLPDGRIDEASTDRMTDLFLGEAGADLGLDHADVVLGQPGRPAVGADEDEGRASHDRDFAARTVRRVRSAG